MPYIESTDRTRAELEPRTPGELNFAITMLMIGYLKRKGLSYTHLNDCGGACSYASAELYRRIGVPYENNKRIANGDVYPQDLQ